MVGKQVVYHLITKQIFRDNLLPSLRPSITRFHLWQHAKGQIVGGTIVRHLLSPGKTFIHNDKGIKWCWALIGFFFQMK